MHVADVFDRVLRLVAHDQRGAFAGPHAHERLDEAKQQQRHAEGQNEIGDKARDFLVFLALIHDRLDPAQPVGHGNIHDFVPAPERCALHLLKAGGKTAARGLRQVGEVCPVIPRAFHEQEGIDDADGPRDQRQHPPDRWRKQVGHRIPPQIGRDLDRIGHAKKDQPGKQECDHLQAPNEAGVEAVAQHHVDEGHDGHARQKQRNHRLLEFVDKAAHRALGYICPGHRHSSP